MVNITNTKSCPYISPPVYKLMLVYILTLCYKEIKSING